MTEYIEDRLDTIEWISLNLACAVLAMVPSSISMFLFANLTHNGHTSPAGLDWIVGIPVLVAVFVLLRVIAPNRVTRFPVKD